MIQFKIDPLLWMIANASAKENDTSDGRSEVLITLQCDGAIISGKVTTEKDYLLGHRLTEELPCVRLPERLIDVGDCDPTEARRLVSSAHLHLRSAKIYIAGFTVEHDFWRVRLEHVSGYSIGKLELRGPLAPAPTQSAA